MLAAMLIVMSGVDKDSVVTGARRSRQEKLHSDMADKAARVVQPVRRSYSLMAQPY